MKLWAIALMMVTASCRASPQGTPAPTPSYKPIDGFRDLKLGSSFEGAIGLLDHELFNPVSIKSCFDDLAIKGCSLTKNSEDTVYEMRDGIPYALQLSFNRDDKLTELTLTYKREGQISGEQCKRVLARTIDWVVKDYGPVSWEHGLSSVDRAKLKPEATPGGNEYVVGGYLKEGSFVSQFHYVDSAKWITKFENGKRREVNTSRNLSVFASYIVLEPSDRMCSVDVTIAEPDSLANPEPSE